MITSGELVTAYWAIKRPRECTAGLLEDLLPGATSSERAFILKRIRKRKKLSVFTASKDYNDYRRGIAE